MFNDIFADPPFFHVQDVTQMLRSAKNVPPRMTRRLSRRLSSDKEQLEERLGRPDAAETAETPWGLIMVNIWLIYG